MIRAMPSLALGLGIVGEASGQHGCPIRATRPGARPGIAGAIRSETLYFKGFLGSRLRCRSGVALALVIVRICTGIGRARINEFHPR